jgi:3-demethoxyubiquinol 3-hydroxylase
MSTLRLVDPAAVSAIRSIIDDERAHRDRARFQSTAGLFWPRILRPVVSWATETVIWLGMRL